MAEHAGISIAPTETRSIAGIGALRDRDRFFAVLHAEFGVSIPVAPRFVRAGAATLSCLSPTRYLASGDAESHLPSRLANKLGGLAAITDQGDMWTTFVLSGPLVRELLARFVPIDLTPSSFSIGDLALTRAGHLNVRLWRMSDLGYELAVTRSCGEYLYAILDMQSRSLVRP